MLIRPKPFLTFLLLCVAPLLVLSLINLRNGSKTTEQLVRRDLEDELTNVTQNFESLLRERQDELIALARSHAMRDYVRAATTRSPASATQSRGSTSPDADEVPEEVKRETLFVLSAQRFHDSIACVDPSGRLMFTAEPRLAKSEGSSVTFRTKDLLPGLTQPDPRVWTAAEQTAICSIVTGGSFGEALRCSVPVFAERDDSKGPRAALVADLSLDSLFSEAARGWEGLLADGGATTAATRQVIVLDTSGRIVYHANPALEHQLIGGSMPYFSSVAGAMTLGQSGWTFYESSAGDRWLAVFAQFKSVNLSLAVARNYSFVSHAPRVYLWTGIVLSILIGSVAAFLLAVLYQRKMKSIERVSAGVAAIAGGNLDQQLQVRSRDDMRLVADSVNLMTERMREQIAREAESRQFEAFVKLSAMLTHDLKNAIEGLSLMVNNMERHFDNPEFRADAMKALTSATDKLRALVARLSNPVHTLSGEFRRPRPTDLVPMMKRVLDHIAKPLRGTHQIDARLPGRLFALADGERIEKVMENLVLNAVEAMSGKSGKLTVEAGSVDRHKVFFRVTDTGEGMSEEFIKKRLFRPFVTRKKNGVGLGLYTCREVVRANGGVIEVESIKGSGTTFRVVLASAENR